jgi:hypothetical protein
VQAACRSCAEAVPAGAQAFAEEVVRSFGQRLEQLALELELLHEREEVTTVDEELELRLGRQAGAPERREGSTTDAPGRNRTCDAGLRRAALYPLSYRGLIQGYRAFYEARLRCRALCRRSPAGRSVSAMIHEWLATKGPGSRRCRPCESRTSACA